MESILWVLLDLYSDETPTFVAVVCGTEDQVVTYAEQLFMDTNYITTKGVAKDTLDGQHIIRKVFPDGRVGYPVFEYFPLDIVELG